MFLYTPTHPHTHTHTHTLLLLHPTPKQYTLSSETKCYCFSFPSGYIPSSESGILLLLHPLRGDYTPVVRDRVSLPPSTVQSTRTVERPGSCGCLPGDPERNRAQHSPALPIVRISYRNRETGIANCKAVGFIRAPLITPTHSQSPLPGVPVTVTSRGSGVST